LVSVRFSSLSRFSVGRVVDQAVEQRGLQALLGGELGHLSRLRFGAFLLRFFGGSHRVEQDLAHVHQRVLAGIAAEHALAGAGPHLGAQLAPLGLARELQFAVFALLGAFVARGNEREGFAAVLELQVRGHPDAVAQVLGRLDLHVREPRVRNPVVLAVDEGLEHGAQAHVGIGQPLEGRAVDGARDGGGAVERALAQVLGQFALAAPCRSSDSMSSASHSSGWPKIMGVRVPANTSARRPSQRTASPYTCFIGTASASSSAATVSWLSARSHWPMTQSSCAMKTRCLLSEGLARTSSLNALSAATGSADFRSSAEVVMFNCP
jgi:hypothetical protein